MALVLTVKVGNAVAYVYDDAYRDCTPEEMVERRRKFDQVVSDILSVPENRARLEDMYRNGGGWRAKLADPNRKVEVKWE